MAGAVSHPPLLESSSSSEEGPSPGLSKPMPMEIRSLLEAGRKLFGSKEEAQALSAFKKALLLCGSPWESSLCLFNLGAAYIATGKPRKGLRCLQKAQRAGAVREGDADFCFNVGAAHECMKNYRKAAGFYRRAVDGGGGEGPRGLAEAQVKLAYCLASLGEAAPAAGHFRCAGMAYREAQLAEEAAMALREAANYSLRSTAFPPKEVFRLLEESIQMCGGISNPKLQGKLYNDVGLHYAELGRFEEAEGCFQEALRLCGGGGGGGASAQSRATLLQNLGAVCNARGHFTRSLGFHTEAASLYGALGESHHGAHAQSLYNLASAHGQAKNPRMAEFYFLQARKSFAEAGDQSGEGRACEELGSLHLRWGHRDLAAQYYREALGLFAESKETSGVPQERLRAKLAALSEY